MKQKIPIETNHFKQLKLLFMKNHHLSIQDKKNEDLKLNLKTTI